MLCVLQIVERSDGLRVEGLSGMYVQDYNPRVDWDMNYTLVVVDRPSEAKLFADEREAWNYLRQVCPNVPTLPDGSPNRPLTSWYVQIVPLNLRDGDIRH